MLLIFDKFRFFCRESRDWCRNCSKFKEFSRISWKFAKISKFLLSNNADIKEFNSFNAKTVKFSRFSLENPAFFCIFSKKPLKILCKFCDKLLETLNFAEETLIFAISQKSLSKTCFFAKNCGKSSEFSEIWRFR